MITTAFFDKFADTNFSALRRTGCRLSIAVSQCYKQNMIFSPKISFGSEIQLFICSNILLLTIPSLLNNVYSIFIKFEIISFSRVEDIVAVICFLSNGSLSTNKRVQYMVFSGKWLTGPVLHFRRILQIIR